MDWIARDLPDHEGTLMSGVVTCSCGWRSEHHVLGLDALSEWEEHVKGTRKETGT